MNPKRVVRIIYIIIALYFALGAFALPIAGYEAISNKYSGITHRGVVTSCRRTDPQNWETLVKSNTGRMFSINQPFNTGDEIVFTYNMFGRFTLKSVNRISYIFRDYFTLLVITFFGIFLLIKSHFFIWNTYLRI